MFLNVENPKIFTIKLPELIREFNKVPGFKINIKNQLYLFILATNIEELKLRKQLHSQYNKKY